MTSRRLRPCRIGLLLLVIAGCQKPVVPAPYEFSLHAESDGAPLAGVRFSRDKRELGITGSSGDVLASVVGEAGSSVQFTAECPEGYQSPSAPVLATLHRESRRPVFKVDCSATTRRVVIAVRAANGADLPIMYLGQAVGRTDSSGAGHIALRVPAYDSVQLALDTSARPRLKPQNPTANFTVTNQDQLFVFDTQFVSDGPRAAPRVARGPAAPRGPIRLEAH